MRGSRTELFRVLRRLLHGAARAGLLGEPAATATQTATSRRAFLSRSGAALAGTMLGGCTTLGTRHPARSSTGAAPRIAIVGAGLAGLSAAYHLQRARLPTVLYEASARVGGRVFSVRDRLGPGLVTELGAEFIDTGHADLLALVRRFRLQLLDIRDDRSATLEEETFVFGGTRYSARQLGDALQPLVPKLKRDALVLEEGVDYRDASELAQQLDRMSLEEYLDQLGASGWVRALIDAAYCTEYGLEIGEQSALNFISLLPTTAAQSEPPLYGESDERFKVIGGNHRLAEALAAAVHAPIERGLRWVRLSQSGAGFRLVFDRVGGSTIEVDADIVIAAIPFTLLRDVELQLPLPPQKRRAIGELGYGTNSKLLVGFRTRPWRAQGIAANIVSDAPFQVAWDNSRLQPGPAGGLTFFLGGERGAAVDREPAALVESFAAGFDAIVPGAFAQRSGAVERFSWPTFPWSRGSYSCYRVGQWTSLRGAEVEPVGNLLFAGEHCSRDWQGFMNGAVESGRVAAAAVLRQVQSAR